MARAAGIARPEEWLNDAGSSPRTKIEVFEQKMKTQLDAEQVLRCGELQLALAKQLCGQIGNNP